MTEEFIESMYKYIDWDYLVISKVLSESFIERNYFHLNWQLVSRHQALSIAFIKANLYRLSKNDLMMNEKMDYETKSIIKDLFDEYFDLI